MSYNLSAYKITLLMQGAYALAACLGGLAIALYTEIIISMIAFVAALALSYVSTSLHAISLANLKQGVGYIENERAANICAGVGALLWIIGMMPLLALALTW